MRSEKSARADRRQAQPPLPPLPPPGPPLTHAVGAQPFVLELLEGGVGVDDEVLHAGAGELLLQAQRRVRTRGGSRTPGVGRRTGGAMARLGPGAALGRSDGSAWAARARRGPDPASGAPPPTGARLGLHPPAAPRPAPLSPPTHSVGRSIPSPTAELWGLHPFQVRSVAACRWSWEALLSLWEPPCPAPLPPPRPHARSAEGRRWGELWGGGRRQKRSGAWGGAGSYQLLAFPRGEKGRAKLGGEERREKKRC